MKKTLSEIFEGRYVRADFSGDAEHYYWYRDEEHVPIGISKDITQAEQDLIELNYLPIYYKDLPHADKYLWMGFLINDYDEDMLLSLPPVRDQVTKLGFIFFQHDFDAELEQAFESLASSFRDDFYVIFCDDVLCGPYGYILDFSTEDEEESEEVHDFLLAAKQDFSENLTFYRTFHYDIDRNLPAKLSFENRQFSFIREELDPSVGVIDYKAGMINIMVAEAEVNARWFPALATLDAEILSVVKCYLESGFNITMGAKLLHMHRNTFMNKLDRFTEEIDLDIKQFEQAMIAYLLIKKMRKDV